MSSKNLVPRNSGEGGLGTSLKPWGSGYYDDLYVTGADGAFIKVEGGGGGGTASAAGSITEIQFNNGGSSFGASSNLTWNGSELNVQGGITGSSISGTTGTFLQRPSVNGSGVLLQGEAAGSEGEIQFADAMGDFSSSSNLTWDGTYLNAYSLSGYQVTGEYIEGTTGTFLRRPSVDGTGVLLQGEASTAAGNQYEIQWNDGANGLDASSLFRWEDGSSALRVEGIISGSSITGEYLDCTTGTFLRRPSVDGTGVLLQGEAASTSAGGNDTEVQYNNADSFAGSSNFTWNNSNSSLSVIGSISGESLSGNSLDISGATPQLNIRGSSSQYIYLHHSSGAAAIGLGESDPSLYITPPSGLDFFLGFRYGGGGGELMSITHQNGHLIPGFSGEQDLGSADKPWRDLYVEENSIYLGGEKISVGDNQLKLNDKTVASDFSIREVSSLTDTTLITDYLKQVHVQTNCTVTLPSDSEFENFKTTYTAIESDIYIGFEADDGGGSVSLEGKASGINGQWDWANVYRSDGNWYIEGNNLRNASNTPIIDGFTIGTKTNTTIPVNLTINQACSGYVDVVVNGDPAPSINTLKASSFNDTNILADTEKTITITSLSVGTAYDVYAYVENAAGEGTAVTAYASNPVTTERLVIVIVFSVSANMFVSLKLEAFNVFMLGAGSPLTTTSTYPEQAWFIVRLTGIVVLVFVPIVNPSMIGVLLAFLKLFPSMYQFPSDL